MAKAQKSQQKKSLEFTKKNAEEGASSPIDSDLRFFILRPGKTRREWAIQAYKEPIKRGPRTYLKSDTDIFKELALRCKSINEHFRAKGLTENQAEDMLQEIIKEYRTRQGTKEFALRTARLSRANEALLSKFWEKRYAHKNIVSPESAQADFHRALRLAADVSMYVATPGQIKENLEENCKDINQYRRAVASLNEILKFVGRDFLLSKPEKGIKEIQYISENEVKTLANSAPNELFKLLTWTLFGTGCRYSEALAINVKALVQGERKLLVDKQKKRAPRKGSKPKKFDSGHYKLPKRGKRGRVVIITSAWEYVQEWAGVNEDEKLEFSYSEYYNWIVATSQKLWPDEKRKHISPHDLRHSHAIYLLDHGATIVEVARNLRNRIEICQEYYTGHEHTDDSLDILLNKI